jgi:hypothetical protein
MTKTIEVQLSQLKFPPTCVVCMSPASKQYGVSQVFSQGTRSATVHINVPMCSTHFEAASASNSAEKIVATCGVIVGIVAGIAALIILILRWVPTGNDSIILKLFIGSIVGFGVFIMVWALFTFWIAPMFAAGESKEARNAVRIVLVSPNAEILRLEFMNEQLAEIVQKQNPFS